MISIIKKQFYKLNEAYKIFKRFLENQIETPILILLYHRVETLDDDPELLCVSSNNFDIHLKYLKQNFHVLYPDELYEIIKNKHKNKFKSVLITFDDGYYDNFTNAFEILKSHNLPALFFVSTYLINKKDLFFWDKLRLICNYAFKNNFKNSSITFKNKLRIDLNFNNIDNLNITYRHLHKFFKSLKANDKQQYILKLCEKLNINLNKLIDENYNKYKLINEDMLKQIGNSKLGFIGAHTHTHSQLSVYNFNEQFTEIYTSKILLEKIIQKPVEYFSYPFGGYYDYDKNSIKICKNLNFKLVFSAYYGQCHSWIDRYQIPRIIIRNWDLTTFSNNILKSFKI